MAWWPAAAGLVGVRPLAAAFGVALLAAAWLALAVLWLGMRGGVAAAGNTATGGRTAAR